MLNRSETASIIIVTIILGFVLALQDWKISLSTFLYATLMIFIIIVLNILVKKYVAFRLDSNIETGVWKWQRYWVHESAYFKNPIPMGAVLPFILGLFSAGSFAWLASLEFEVSPSLSRVSKRHGLYRFSEMTEWHIALIAGTGVIANLLLALICYIFGGHLGGFLELGALSVYYAAFNLLPISNLDGSKIFFGSLVLWVTLAIITAIGVGVFAFII